MKYLVPWFLLVLSVASQAQVPDTILVNGKVLTVDTAFSTQQALAIRDGKISALGTSVSIRAQAGPATRIIDLDGRTVIPGLIDSHMHAIRAAVSFATEVNWIGAKTMAEAMDRIRTAAASKPPGSWLIVAGGWTADQFAERRRPTQAELMQAAPNNPVYVQLGYSWAMLTPAAYRALGIADESAPAENGAVTGGQATIIALFDRLPKPTFEQSVDGTHKFFTELNRLGITGIVDPGGNNLFAADYQPLLEVWRKRELTVRVAYTLNGQTDGKEFDEFKGLTQLLPMGMGDDYLRFNGLGERITVAMNNNNRPDETVKEKYYQIIRWAAERGMSLTMHWGGNASVNQLLDIFDKVNREVPIAPLRWSIAHLGDANEATLRHMKSLGVGWTVQDASYFGGSQTIATMPDVNLARTIGVAVGAGTDAHRVMSYNPFTALQWFVDAKTVAGGQIRGPKLSREEALRIYTLGSAWFSFDESKRGSLEVGKLADLAVLSKDYMTVPAGEIGEIESVLTMVGGKVVYSK